MNTNDQMNKNQRNTNKRTDPRKRNERGYALIGLMAVMMFAMILTTATAPTLRQEMQREKEEEMLWRGQQVAYAIKRYRDIPGRNRTFPTDLNELVKGIDLGGKKIHLLRPSAMCDPMTPCVGETNWRMVHPGDPLPKELLDGILSTQDKSPMTVNPQGIMELTKFAQMGSVKLPGQPADTQLDGNIGPVDNQGADSGSGSDDKTKKLPIIGVVSRKSDKMFRSYYGIEEYDHALFFSEVPVMAGGFINPFALGSTVVAGGAGGGRDSRCPNGGLFVDGKCYGTLLPGQYCRGKGGKTVLCADLNK